MEWRRFKIGKEITGKQVVTHPIVGEGYTWPTQVHKVPGVAVVRALKGDSFV